MGEILQAALGAGPASAALTAEVSAALAAFGGFGGMNVAPRTNRVADETSKAMLLDARRKPSAFLLCSSPRRPDLIDRAVRIAGAARRSLGEELGRAVLVPVCTGVADGLSYAVFPVCRPTVGRGVAGRLRARLIGPQVVCWLRRATAATAVDASDDAIEQDFAVPLASLAADDEADPDIRTAAAAARGRILNGHWRPRHVLEHGDLWMGNVLRGGASCYPLGFPLSGGFAITDWAGGIVRGHAIHDLVRLAASTRMRAPALATEIRCHCRMLACDPADAAGYLLAALGHLGRNLGCFPRRRYLQQVAVCWRRLQAARAVSAPGPARRFDPGELPDEPHPVAL